MLVRFDGGRYFQIGAHIYIVGDLAVVAIIFADIKNIRNGFKNRPLALPVLERLSAGCADLGRVQ